MTHRALFMISSMRGGGSERQTLLLLKHLDRAIFSPHLYVMEKAGDLLSQVPSDIPIHSFEDVRKDPLIYLPGGVMRQQVRHLKKLLADESIDVIYDRTFHMTIIAGPASRQLKIPRVSTIVSPPELALPLVEKRFVRMKQHRLSKAYKQSQQIIAVSKMAAESAMNFYQLPSKSVVVLPNPVDSSALLQTAALQSRQNDQSTLKLVCVGRMTEEKGHRDLIDAFAIAQTNWADPNTALHLQLIGDGPLRADLELQAEKIKNPCSVTFSGALSDVGPSIAQADALILPSLFEGMPNVVLEAMALQTPVIATRAGGTVELEREEPTILWAEPKNAESLAEAILSFASNPESSAARSQAATRLIKEHHNVETTCNRLEEYLLTACC
ncbi:glycosyltransferase [bacterium]|nr:glycosyltransferase [bacterium]